jgi:hypothetical protein
MAFADPLEYEDARQALKASATIIRACETDIDEQIRRAAEAAAEYNGQLARKVITLRTNHAEGEKAMGATEAELRAKGSAEVVAYATVKDIEEGRVKLAFAKLENRRGDRASLHKVVDWSMKFVPLSSGETRS